MASTTNCGPAARRYASALLSAAREADAVDAVASDMQALAEVVCDSSLAAWLSDPRVDDSSKQAAFSKALGDACHALTTGLLGVLANRRRHSLLIELPTAFQAELDVLQGRLRGTVESAFDLDDPTKAELESAFSNSTGKEVLLETHRDESLLGGLRVTLDGVRYDGTARGRLDNLRARLANADLGATN